MQCVSAVEPHWLASAGPMFFSVKETNSSLKEAKARRKEEKELMALELEASETKKKEDADAARRKEASLAARRRGQIVTPGRRALPATPVGESGVEAASAGSVNDTGKQSQGETPRFSFKRPDSVRRDGGEKRTPRRVGL